MITNEQIEVLKSWADDYGAAFTMQVALGALRAAIKTLEALPTTKDGVRVSPGMKVYAVRLKDKDIAEIEACGSGMLGPWIYLPEDCYSNRDAAERAALDS